MTIDEIKSVSILQWMRANNYGEGIRKGQNYFFCSPLRSERTPSFSVNTVRNLWCDFGSADRNGGNIINLVEQLNPSWSEHEVLTYLERQIRDLHLDFSEDYNARLEEEEKKRRWVEGKQAEREEHMNQETIVEAVIPLSHPILRDYIIQRRIAYNVAQRYCKEVHFSLRGKRYYAIAFMNVGNGMEARNKYSKRCIGNKDISVIRSDMAGVRHCCVFEGFFDFLSYVTLKQLGPNNVCIADDCDCIVLNSVNNIGKAFPVVGQYEYIHCYLDNDNAGHKATETLLGLYPEKAIDESYRYQPHNDLNDMLIFGGK